MDEKNRYRCGFNLCWISCHTDVANEGDRCEKHTNPICECCGKPATRMCGETGPMQFVCRTLICDECQHVLTTDGCSIVDEVHVKPREPNGIPWMIQDAGLCDEVKCTLGLGKTHCQYHGRNGCIPLVIWLDWHDKMNLISKKHPKYTRLMKKMNKRLIGDVRKYIRNLGNDKH